MKNSPAHQTRLAIDHAGPPCVALLLLLVCLCTSACQHRVPASASGTWTTHASTNATMPGAERTSDDVEQEAPEQTPGQAAGQAAIASEAPAAVAEDAEAKPPGSEDQTIPITFDDLKLEMEKDTVFDPSLLTERVKQLDGRRVRVRGFIFPSVFQQTGITSFPLIKNLQCKFGPGGQAHHIVLVEMKPGLSTDFTVRPIAVEGILSVKPWAGPDGNTWALYHMLGEAVE